MKVELKLRWIWNISIKHSVIMDFMFSVVQRINYSSQIILPPYACPYINAFIKNVSWFDFIVKSSQNKLINILLRMMKCFGFEFFAYRGELWIIKATQQIAHNIYSIDLRRREGWFDIFSLFLWQCHQTLDMNILYLWTLMMGQQPIISLCVCS